MDAPVRLVVLLSASEDGLLRCLKYAISQLLDTGVDVLAVISVKFSAQHISQVLSFCSFSWVPSFERWSVLSVSLSIEPAGGRCLPAGCKPPCHRSSGRPRLRQQRSGERSVGWSSGLLMRIRLFSIIQSSICFPLLLRSAYQHCVMLQAFICHCSYVKCL